MGKVITVELVKSSSWIQFTTTQITSSSVKTGKLKAKITTGGVKNEGNRDG